jgi:hypothetical protein
MRALVLTVLLTGAGWVDRAEAQDTLLVVLQKAAEFSLQEGGLELLGSGLVFDTAHFSRESFSPELVSAIATFADRHGARLGVHNNLVECKERSPELFRRRCRLAEGTEAILHLGRPQFDPEEGGWVVNRRLTRFFEDRKRGEHWVAAGGLDLIVEPVETGDWSVRLGDKRSMAHWW